MLRGPPRSTRTDPPFSFTTPFRTKRLPALEAGDRVKLADLIADQHFTEPPPRYTEASLVKTLEEYDIGRPSTYASIISTLQARDYVRPEGKAFRSEEHTSELQSLMRLSYAVFCLKKKKNKHPNK